MRSHLEFSNSNKLIFFRDAELKNQVKVDPSKNKRKIDETIQTTFSNQGKTSKNKKKIVTEHVNKMSYPNTKDIINKEGKFTISYYSYSYSKHKQNRKCYLSS